MTKKTFTFIEVLVAMAVFVVGIAPILGLMAANSRQFRKDQLLFKENDVLIERMAAVRTAFESDKGCFDDGADTSLTSEESPRYLGVYSVGEATVIGEFGVLVTIGIGSSGNAATAISTGAGASKSKSLRQHTIFLVKPGDN